MEKLPLLTTNEILKNCAFTGHRELDESFSIEKLKKVLDKWKFSTTHFK